MTMYISVEATELWDEWWAYEGISGRYGWVWVNTQFYGFVFELLVLCLSLLCVFLHLVKYTCR